jgi:pilus assembly protein Flp/PilA
MRPGKQGNGDASGDSGATAIEYALLAALIALTIIAALIILGGGVRGLWEDVATHVISSS